MVIGVYRPYWKRRGATSDFKVPTHVFGGVKCKTNKYLQDGDRILSYK